MQTLHQEIKGEKRYRRGLIEETIYWNATNSQLYDRIRDRGIMHAWIQWTRWRRNGRVARVYVRTLLTWIEAQLSTRFGVGG
jgi:hypothetical protein